MLQLVQAPFHFLVLGEILPLDEIFVNFLKTFHFDFLLLNIICYSIAIITIKR